jgi:hypothetical protein
MTFNSAIECEGSEAAALIKGINLAVSMLSSKLIQVPHPQVFSLPLTGFV